MFSNILEAFSSAISPTTVLLLLVGTGAGILIGAMPGLSVNMGIALLYPLTFAFDGVAGIIMLIGVYCGAIYGGSISAILLKTPGTPASAATTLDGYPMANKMGQPGRALGLSTMASTFGGVFSAICLMILAPQLAKVALTFSKAEYFALALFGISIITSVSSGSILKGLMGGALGLFISTIGVDGMTGKMRFDFGSTYLLGGISFIPILIGLFAFSQVLASVEGSYNETFEKKSIKIKKVLPAFSDIKRVFITMLRSSAIGTFIGCIPGTGGDISSFICYDQAKKWSKDKENFGNGEPKGIVACEAGNNSVSGGAMIPMLTLGIPGDGATAILLGALMVQGIAPGPLLFANQPIQVYTIFIGLLLANIAMGAFGFSLIRVFSKVINVPKEILIPIIFVMTFVGTYSYNHSMTDVYVMVFFGFLGYFMNKTQFSMSAIILGIILGGTAEQNFSGALIMSKGSFSIFFTRPICSIFIIISVLSLLSPLYSPLFKKVFKKKAA
ncbi:putative tricarboxylic transport membrane protein [Anaerobacterium chartisolvens]|uniref:Putative tricarboxylic transport membrane protein n=1 Tax=Anaerobacterium chartisolvens TaxID=1297424 RepID=A0A369BFH0_9FIRM|nr:tripartite tricarboxylate transporter permease [Anaerobacterium chartisolvens]RCX19358.1 putative tricarboxylic transport membrane protein [Anaerobacterium chartisolvens]